MIWYILGALNLMSAGGLAVLSALDFFDGFIGRAIGKFIVSIVALSFGVFLLVTK